MSLETWREHCRNSAAIKVLLLDQKVVAGIGNLYASEILHVAKIHPATPANRLKADQVRRLRDATLAVLEEAIRNEGSTLGDAAYRTALNQNGRYQNKHLVYRHTDEICPTCGEVPIRQIVQAQRSTFYCPVCQHADAKGAAAPGRFGLTQTDRKWCSNT